MISSWCWDSAGEGIMTRGDFSLCDLCGQPIKLVGCLKNIVYAYQAAGGRRPTIPNHCVCNGFAAGSCPQPRRQIPRCRVQLSEAIGELKAGDRLCGIFIVRRWVGVRIEDPRD
jgi:hypothetical protein